MSIFKADDWYWIIGDDRARVFSSKKNTYVGTDDAEYVAWLDLQNIPSTAESETELSLYMSEAYPGVAISFPAALIAYASTRHIEATIGGNKVSLSVAFSADSNAADADASDIASWATAMLSRMPDIILKIKTGELKSRAEIDAALSA